MHVFEPGDRVHFDGDRTGHPTPRDDPDYEPPAWGTIATNAEVGGIYRIGNGEERIAVRWDDPEHVNVQADVTFALISCLVPASEAPEPDPKES